MSRRFLLLALAPITFVCASACRTLPSAADATEARDAVTWQVDSWNRGDIEGFLSVYERSAETTFVSRGAVKRGFEEVAASFRAGYPAGKLGKLAFTDLAARAIAPDVVIVTGRYDLDREPKQKGLFTVVLRRVDGVMKIVHDHTSE